MITPAVIFSMVHTFQTVQSVFVQSPPLSCIENQSDDHDDDNVELPSQFISFVVSTLTPFRKFLKHITSLINQANTRVTMAWITNTNYCLDDSQRRLESARKVSWGELSN